MAGNRDHREMPETPLHDLSNPEERHEHSDVNVWAIGKFAIALLLLCIATLGGLFGLYRYFQARENAEQAPLREESADAQRLPPEPRLQTAPVLDLKQIRGAEDQILGSYGWIDQPKGVVRLPIERAMDLLAERGLPSRQAAPPADPASVPTESSHGFAPGSLP